MNGPNPDRDRGILTEDDRKYLLGDEEKADLSEGAEYNIKRRIRERTINAFLDFIILWEELPADERDKIFSLDSDHDHRFAIDDGVVAAIAFIFAGVTERLEPWEGGLYSTEFENALLRGLREGYLEFDSILNSLDLEIDSEKAMGIKGAKERLEEGRSLRESDVRLLLRTGEIPFSELQEFLRETLAGDDEE